MSWMPNPIDDMSGADYGAIDVMGASDAAGGVEGAAGTEAEGWGLGEVVGWTTLSKSMDRTRASSVSSEGRKSAGCVAFRVVAVCSM